MLEFNVTLDQPMLSVCVSLKNRSRIVHEQHELTPFPRFVQSLAAAAEDLAVELVVVDYQSDDWPLELWLKNAAGSMPVRVISQDGDFSRGEGINLAVRAAGSDRLFLCDADMLVTAEVLVRGMEVMDQGAAFFPLLRYPRIT